MTTDKTGAETTVSAGDGKYTIAVEGETVGLAAVADRDNQRVFYHTEVDERFGGRGLATILIDEALAGHPRRRQTCRRDLSDGCRLHQKASRVLRHHRSGDAENPALGRDALVLPRRPIRRRNDR